MGDGKCFSMVNQGQRNKDDIYQTPYSLTWELVNHFGIKKFKNKNILEPCSGHGAIIKGLNDKGIHEIISKDLNTTGEDFYKETGSYDLIITNPSFKKTHLFIEKCFDVAPDFFLLLPVAHLQGNERFKRQTYKHLKEVAIFTRMVAFEKNINEDGSFTTGMMPTGWFYFKKTRIIKQPKISFIDVQKYVSSARKSK